MRTKTLIGVAALALAGAATASAQVYSVNAVGYINLPIPTGFTLIANQLESGDNTVGSLLPASEALEGVTIYKFGDAGYEINAVEFGEWGLPGQTLNPGEGAWILNPTGEAFTITLVGEVPQGELTNPLPGGLSIRSSIVPQAGLLSTDLGFPALDGDIVYQWEEGAGYTISGVEFGEWSPEPTLKVGESFWLNRTGTGGEDWVRDFSVNP